MEDIPSNLMLDILSRIPLKPLVRLQCVSKLWCQYINDSYLAVMHGERFIEEEPTLMMLRLNPKRPPRSLCFHVTDQSLTTNNNTLVFKPKKLPVFEFLCNSKSSNVEFRGSCNGLIYVSEVDDEFVTTLSVIHPMKKQCYKLPTFPIPFHDAFMIKKSCGIGFDSSTKNYKMVCVVLNKNHVDNLCTMVHVFGRNTSSSWREIPQVPLHPICGEAIFANGCLHWLVNVANSPTYYKDERRVVWFDVKREVFGLINPVKTTSNKTKRKFNSCGCDHLVNLNGQVGYFCNRTTEVWVLNHKKKEWALHCNFEDDHDFPYGYLKVLGCLNKQGDLIFIKCTPCESGKDLFYVYNLRSRVLHEADVDGREDESETNIVMFPNSLLTIHDIITHNNLIKKTSRLRKKASQV